MPTPKPQTMKPQTAAKKLGVLLSETPADFQEGVVSRTDLNALQAEPPEWLATLRRNGPHTRQETARRLGISNSGLTRGGVGEHLTTDEIKAVIDEMPAWLVAEREIFAQVRAEDARLRHATPDGPDPMSETVRTFRTTLEATGGNNVGIVVPDEVMAAFARGKRVPVSVTVDGGYTYRTSIASMGGHFLVS